MYLPNPYKFSKTKILVSCTIVFVAALSIRLGLLYYGQNTPLMYAHKWDQSDMDFFDRWAKDISEGDWLNRKGPLPYHIWHQTLTKNYFEAKPQDTLKYQKKAQELALIDSTMSMGKALIYEWYGGPTFHQEPLYVYLVTLTYKTFGHDVLPVFIWQAFMGAFTTALLFGFVLYFFGIYAGILTTMLALLCGPFIFFDMVLLRTSLAALFGVALLILAYASMITKNNIALFATGCISGLSIKAFFDASK